MLEIGLQISESPASGADAGLFAVLDRPCATMVGVTRIVAGKAGGRRIDVPQKGTRPMADRVRESVFGSLETLLDFDGARVLDLYSGSGALGLESLSRGADRATLVEADRAAARLLRRNIDVVGLPGARIEQAKVESFLAGTPSEPYDLVFVDPPYALEHEKLQQVLAQIARWTEPESLVIMERQSRSPEPAWPPPLEAFRTRAYGGTTVYWGVHAAPAGDQ